MRTQISKKVPMGLNDVRNATKIKMNFLMFFSVVVIAFVYVERETETHLNTMQCKPQHIRNRSHMFGLFRDGSKLWKNTGDFLKRRRG